MAYRLGGTIIATGGVTDSIFMNESIRKAAIDQDGAFRKAGDAVIRVVTGSYIRHLEDGDNEAIEKVVRQLSTAGLSCRGAIASIVEVTGPTFAPTATPEHEVGFLESWKDYVDAALEVASVDSRKSGTSNTNRTLPEILAGIRDGLQLAVDDHYRRAADDGCASANLDTRRTRGNPSIEHAG